MGWNKDFADWLGGSGPLSDRMRPLGRATQVFKDYYSGSLTVVPVTTTIQAAINEAVALGEPTIVSVPAGTYREALSLGGTGADITLMFADGAAVSGCNVVNTGWVNVTGNVWSHASMSAYNFGVQTQPVGWPTMTNIMRRRELVLVNGVPYRQLGSQVAVEGQANSFYVDGATQTYYIRTDGTNPNGATVEIGARDTCLAITRPNVTVQGGRFYGSSNIIQGGAVTASSAATGLSLNNVRADFNVWSGIRSQASDARFHWCNTSDNGVSGYGISNCDGVTMSWHQNHRNNWRGGQNSWEAWETGAKFFRVSALNVHHYYANDNYANGMWLDTGNSGVLEDIYITGSRGWSANARAGLYVEVNRGPLVFRRLRTVGNDRDGFWLASANVTFEDCESFGNGRAAFVTTGDPGRPDLLDRATGETYVATLDGNKMTGCVFGAPTGERINQHEVATTNQTSQLSWDQFVDAEEINDNTYYSDVANPFTHRVADAFAQTTLAGWRSTYGFDADSTLDTNLANTPALGAPSWVPAAWM